MNKKNKTYFWPEQKRKKMAPTKKTGRGSWTGNPWGVWVWVWFSSWLYYPFVKGQGQHQISDFKIKSVRTKERKKRLTESNGTPAMDQTKQNKTKQNKI